VVGIALFQAARFNKDFVNQPTLFWAALALVLGFGGGSILFSSLLRSKNSQAHSNARDAQDQLAALQADLARRQQLLQLESRDETQREMSRLRELIEGESATRRAELKETESRLREHETLVRERESTIERRAKTLDGRERSLQSKESDLDKRHLDAQKLVELQSAELHRIASLSPTDARDVVLSRAEAEARTAMAQVAARIEEQARENAEERARKILALAIQRCAVDQTSETAVSVVVLPSEDLKGRIIGREGRNIRTFEQLSGTDLIIDDTPEAVMVSCFDPVRREIARIALASLVTDGRIHPARIEETLARAEGEVQQKMREAAERATTEANVRLPKPVLEVFGKLLYRTSYGQNILQHSVEMAKIASSIAAELGADVQVAKRAALLHDIGKALDHDHEGTHVDLGIELLKRHRESDAVIRAAGEHHLDVEQMTSLESVIVQVADMISSSRPGARRENVEIYIKRLETLEKIADSFPGVEKSYAIQAGREVRIVVRPDQVDDLAAMRLARDVAQRVQDEMTYPGEIRVTVIRETRAMDVAR
jgi:ribonuclease Y